MSTHDEQLRLGDLVEECACPMCEGEGFQLELRWVTGEDAVEREVACFECEGSGRVVELVCGRCGEVEHGDPADLAHDAHICSMCGHHAPKFLWLPMRHVHIDDEKREETA